ITSTDANAVMVDDNGGGTAGTLTLVAGTGMLSSFTFQTVGTRTVTATDVAAPGTATGKTAAAPTAQTAGTAIASGIVVNAVDANWNVVSTATPNVTIISS